MLIDEQVPQAIGGRAPLREAFADEAIRAGLSLVDAQALFREVPIRLSQAECFFDRLSKRWLYEFGRPLKIQNWRFDSGRPVLVRRDVYGPHVWHPVAHLVSVTMCATRVLTDPKVRDRYMARLDQADKHEAVLVEFMPALRFTDDVDAQFEALTGAGNRDADWRLVKRGVRPILIEVKRRSADILALFERVAIGERRPDGTAPQPSHDASLIFRSIEQKYPKSDPDVQLQGAWVVTALKQDSTDLERAFDALDGDRVHFVVLGGWTAGVRVLVRREEDRDVVLDVLNEHERSDGFVFDREPPGR